ncbi:MAG: hypothetical protein KH295_05885 [Clostridiaceae bacterium]|nr:hypothetical protein [uncultured Agathobaculum sp.]MBS6640567.1 hypothetical protein [Clostridiaceae bacterium]
MARIHPKAEKVPAETFSAPCIKSEAHVPGFYENASGAAIFYLMRAVRDGARRGNEKISCYGLIRGL